MKNHHHNHPIHARHAEGAPSHEVISAHAQALWVEHGRPEHQDEAIWLEAESQLLAEQNRTKGNLGLSIDS